MSVHRQSYVHEICFLMPVTWCLCLTSRHFSSNILRLSKVIVWHWISHEGRHCTTAVFLWLWMSCHSGYRCLGEYCITAVFVSQWMSCHSGCRVIVDGYRVTAVLCVCVCHNGYSVTSGYLSCLYTVVGEINMRRPRRSMCRARHTKPH